MYEKQKHCRKVKLDVYENQRKRKTYEYDYNTIILKLCNSWSRGVYGQREKIENLVSNRK